MNQFDAAPALEMKTNDVPTVRQQRCKTLKIHYRFATPALLNDTAPMVTRIQPWLWLRNNAYNSFFIFKKVASSYFFSSAIQCMRP
jgi:hypothetical protein